MANDALDTDNAWDLVLSAINRSNITLPVPGSDQPAVKINGKSWELVQPASEQARNLLSLFLPLCQPVTNNSRVIGQLGQSLDGRIATVTGCSRFINGDDGITHLHRIRALCDAVVVGAGTASTDNPRLTVRRTSGRNPVRVVIASLRSSYTLGSGSKAQELTPGQLLERLGFSNAQLSTPVKDLSGGQQRRLQLLLVLLQNHRPPAPPRRCQPRRGRSRSRRRRPDFGTRAPLAVRGGWRSTSRCVPRGWAR